MVKRRRSVPFSRLARLAVLYCVPTATAMLLLVVLGILPVVPALLATGGVTVALGVLFRPLVADWQACSDALRAPLSNEPGGTPEEPVRELRFSDGAREVMVSATMLRRRAERHALAAESQVQFQASLLDTLPEPLLVITRDRLVSRANKAATQAFGREIVGRQLALVLRDPALLEAVDETLDRGLHRDMQLVLPGVVERTYQVSVEPLDGAEDSADSALVLLNDVTALVRVEQMRADFVANASHELRTPLTSILGFVETLRGPARDDVEAHERFLGIMYQQAMRMKRLIEDLLSLSRIELREHTPPVDAVALPGVIDPVAEGLEIQAAEKDVRIILDLPADLPRVVGDSDELTQVLQNLMGNAIKYGRTGSAVTVRGEAVAQGPAAMPYATAFNCVALRIIDEGDGISKEHLPRLTERFYRVDTARSRQLGGTGLGLAIVKHIVNRHRGRLRIDSALGQGSRFTVILPRAT